MKAIARTLLSAMIVVITMFTFMTAVDVAPAYADVTVETPYLVKVIPSSKQIILSWNRTFANVDGTPKRASGYQLQYSTSSSFKNAEILKYGEEQYRKTFNLPKKASSYYARVRAFYKSGKTTTYSSWRKASTKVSLSKYTYPKITLKGTDNKVTISWPAISDATYFVYRYDNKSWVQIKKITDSNVTTYTDTDRFYKVKYRYLVRAKETVSTTNPPVINASPQITDETNAKEITLACPLTKPTGLTAKSEGNIIRLSWNPVNKADKYLYDYSADKDFKKFTSAYSNTPNAIINNIPEGENIYVRVCAVMDLTAGNVTKTYKSDMSDTVSLQILPYTIKFNGNSASSGQTQEMSVKPGETVKLSKNQFAKEGYEFVGWSKVKNNKIDMKNFQLGNPDLLDEAQITDLTQSGETITLYACWKGAGINAAVDWALKIAEDDTFYYGLVDSKGKLSKTDGHSHCWFCQGGLKVYCCNSFCTAAYQHGMPYFNTYYAGSTGPDWWANKGFTRMGKNYSASKIKKGDLICCYNGSKYSHIMMAISDDSVALEKRKIVNARGWDKGICTQNMLNKLDNYSYYYVLRLKK